MKDWQTDWQTLCSPREHIAFAVLDIRKGHVLETPSILFLQCFQICEEIPVSEGIILLTFEH